MSWLQGKFKLIIYVGFANGSAVKNLPTVQETWV